jgi:hypothetical protein
MSQQPSKFPDVGEQTEVLVEPDVDANEVDLSDLTDADEEE